MGFTGARTTKQVLEAATNPNIQASVRHLMHIWADHWQYAPEYGTLDPADGADADEQQYITTTNGKVAIYWKQVKGVAQNILGMSRNSQQPIELCHVLCYGLDLFDLQIGPTAGKGLYQLPLVNGRQMIPESDVKDLGKAMFLGTDMFVRSQLQGNSVEFVPLYKILTEVDAPAAYKDFWAGEPDARYFQPSPEWLAYMAVGNWQDKIDPTQKVSDPVSD